MGKSLTKNQLKKITSEAKKIRAKKGGRKVTVTKYKMKWTDAIVEASKKVLKPHEQATPIERYARKMKKQTKNKK